VLALALDRELGLLDAKREPLPVEEGDFTVRQPDLKWRLDGTKATGEIVLTIESEGKSEAPPALRPHTSRDAFKEWLRHRPYRPGNHDALYGARRYSTEQTLTRCDPVR
jgi:hypothetical protein